MNSLFFTYRRTSAEAADSVPPISVYFLCSQSEASFFLDITVCVQFTCWAMISRDCYVTTEATERLQQSRAERRREINQ